MNKPTQYTAFVTPCGFRVTSTATGVGLGSWIMDAGFFRGHEADPTISEFLRKFNTDSFDTIFVEPYFRLTSLYGSMSWNVS